MERRLTTAQAAKRLGLEGEAGSRHVLRLIDTGALAAINVSTGTERPRWRITEAEVERYIADREAEARQRATGNGEQKSAPRPKILRQERRDRRWRA